MPAFAGMALLLAFFITGTAHAACSSPPGEWSEIVYNQTEKIMQYCDGTNWQRMNMEAGSGSGGCTAPNADEGEMVFNQTHRVMQVCAGNVWMAMGPVGGNTGGGTWLQVDGGKKHACGIKVDGSLWCWGDNAYGQLGDGTQDTRQSPVLVSGGQSWKMVSAAGIGGSSDGHSCAIRSDDTLWCWGADGSGQLGEGAGTGNQLTPVQESSGSTWKMLSTGDTNTCAIKMDDTLWCWGADDQGQLGNGATTGSQQDPVQEATSSTWKYIGMGRKHTCAIKMDDTLWCWGSDNNGEIGNGATTGNQDTPVQIGSDTWISVSAAVRNSALQRAHTCGVKTDGTLWCWGTQTSGALGNGVSSATPQESPVQESTAATDWSYVVTGEYSGCALKTNNTIYCWGQDNFGQVGNGDPKSTQTTPVQESLGATWAALGRGDDFVCGIHEDGGRYCWGDDSSGQLGDGDITLGYSMTPVQESSSSLWKHISASNDHACGIKTNDTLWCWGANTNGKLATGDQTARSVPTQEISGSAWKKVDVGTNHSCGIKTNDTLWCWGGDFHGELGNGATTGIQTSPSQESSASTWIDVGVGPRQTCGVKTDGTMWCWGNDANGQLANGGAVTANQPDPYQEITASTNWKSVWMNLNNWNANASSGCAIKTDGTLWCWGSDYQGGNGTGGGGSTDTPTQEITSGTDWNILTVSHGYGGRHTCSIKTNGSLYCWGGGTSGQIGDGFTSSRNTATAVSGGANWIDVAGGDLHTCGVKTDKTLHCWGSDVYGQLGNGAGITGNKTTPQLVPGGGTWSKVALGGDFSCALRETGHLYCWGINTVGQLGIGTTGDETSPTPTGCAEPFAEGGVIYFNSAVNKMQYCDGAGWAQMGL